MLTNIPNFAIWNEIEDILLAMEIIEANAFTPDYIIRRWALEQDLKRLYLSVFNNEQQNV